MFGCDPALSYLNAGHYSLQQSIAAVVQIICSTQGCLCS